MIVEDGIVDIYPSSSQNAFELRFKSRGPLWATEQFLKENPDFVVDSKRERYLLTNAPRGFLKRVNIS